MHELNIASEILKRVESEHQRHPSVRFTKVGIRIGELSGIAPDSLLFGFEALVKDTPWDGLALEIESCPRRRRCPTCHTKFQAQGVATTCPVCGEVSTVCIAGDELDIAYIEAEDEK
jgi:hydrogenase nickel incorporation protein HypA/HybF